MSDKYTVCPTCGAIGQIGAVCEYCGKAINEDENERSVTFTLSQEVIPKRTISRPELAEKVSVFSRVDEYVGKCAIASVYISSVLYDGRMYGIVNLNGDILFPPEYDKIVLFEQGYAYLQKDDDCFLFDLMKWKRIEGIPQVDWDKPPKDVCVFYYQGYYAIIVLSSYDYCRAFVFDDKNQCVFTHNQLGTDRDDFSLENERDIPFHFSDEGIILYAPKEEFHHFKYDEDLDYYRFTKINGEFIYESMFDIRTRKKYAAPKRTILFGKGKWEETEDLSFIYNGKYALYNFHAGIDKLVELDFSRPAEEVQTIINEAADKLQAINYAEHGVTLKKSSTPSTSGSVISGAVSFFETLQTWFYILVGLAGIAVVVYFIFALIFS